MQYNYEHFVQFVQCGLQCGGRRGRRVGNVCALSISVLQALSAVIVIIIVSIVLIIDIIAIIFINNIIGITLS